MLHIVNGLATLNVLDRTDLRGARVSGDDILAEGPIIEELQTPASWRIRAEHLQKRFNIPRDHYLNRKEERDRSLRSFGYHEEVILWFEYDLFCQMNLLYLLSWFARQDLGNSKLSLICPGEYPGVKKFRGLGELNARQLTGLFDERAEVTPEQLRLARTAWSAYSSPDAHAIERLLEEGTEELRYLHRAFHAHLERFPSTRNGLNAVENRILELVGDGSRRFTDLFAALTDGLLTHGMGDLQCSAYLAEMASGDDPLIRMENFPGLGAHDAGKASPRWSIRVTDLGKDVAKNRVDSVEKRGIDRWLGGVHISSPGCVWRWDPDAGRLAPPPQ